MNDRHNERLTYDSNGNITELKRWGKTDAGVTGLVDDVRFSYKGNQVVSATDHADAPTYMDAFHYSDDSDGRRIGWTVFRFLPAINTIYSVFSLQ